MLLLSGLVAEVCKSYQIFAINELLMYFETTHSRHAEFDEESV